MGHGARFHNAHADVPRPHVHVPREHLDVPRDRVGHGPLSHRRVPRGAGHAGRRDPQGCIRKAACVGRRGTGRCVRADAGEGCSDSRAASGSVDREVPSSCATDARTHPRDDSHLTAISPRTPWTGCYPVDVVDTRKPLTSPNAKLGGPSGPSGRSDGRWGTEGPGFESRQPDQRAQRSGQAPAVGRRTLSRPGHLRRTTLPSFRVLGRVLRRE